MGELFYGLAMTGGSFAIVLFAAFHLDRPLVRLSKGTGS